MILHRSGQIGRGYEGGDTSGLDYTSVHWLYVLNLTLQPCRSGRSLPSQQWFVAPYARSSLRGLEVLTNPRLQNCQGQGHFHYFILKFQEKIQLTRGVREKDV